MRSILRQRRAVQAATWGCISVEVGLNVRVGGAETAAE